MGPGERGALERPEDGVAVFGGTSVEGRRGEPLEWVGLSQLLSGECPDVGELTSTPTPTLWCRHRVARAYPQYQAILTRPIERG